MVKILSLIRNYFQNHFSSRYFLAVLVFTAILIYLNYSIHFEQNYITAEPRPSLRFIRYFGMYFLSFGGAYLLYLVDRRERHFLRSVELWALLLFAVFLFSFRWWVYQYKPWVYAAVDPYYQTVVLKYITNLSGFVWLFIPCTIYWWLTDRKKMPVYGFHAKGVVLRPYFILLLLMVPLIIIAATQKDFLETYPRLFHLGLIFHETRDYILAFIYEVCYALDFVNTEFFFRGFLILAFARLVGPKSILPMCVFYVAIHFEKPLGETISSFFGGWILGILSYETKSIYGGVIVHLGIALLMEAVALTAHYYFGML